MFKGFQWTIKKIAKPIIGFAIDSLYDTLILIPFQFKAIEKPSFHSTFANLEIASGVFTLTPKASKYAARRTSF